MNQTPKSPSVIQNVEQTQEYCGRLAHRTLGGHWLQCLDGRGGKWKRKIPSALAVTRAASHVTSLTAAWSTEYSGTVTKSSTGTPTHFWNIEHGIIAFPFLRP